MSVERKPLQNFNVDTMSGIYPGSRTLTYQRLRLHAAGEADGQWHQLHWLDQPPAAVLLPVASPHDAPQPLLTIAAPQGADFATRLHTALADIGIVADACFGCRHWQPRSHTTEDGLPAGRCGWQDAAAALPATLATQSALSLACAHFERATVPPSRQPSPDAQPDDLMRVRKSAELDPDRLPFWPRLWHNLRRSVMPSSAATHNWADELLERSGVGAGTEPCFVCQGRLANLGALVVASAEGDKQTLSVWRCRRCYTLFLNDWTDRWERLENLETEELYYRIAPGEAFAALHIIHATVGGEHPARRGDRDQERRAMLALVADKAPLSHQIRQGR
jgi:hypothetical protein